MNPRRYLVLSVTLCIIVAPGLMSHAVDNGMLVMSSGNHETQRMLRQLEQRSVVSTSPSEGSSTSVLIYTVMETVAIIVENTLYESVSEAVNQYRQDLNYTGYNTILYTDLLSTAEELKGNLTQWYEVENLIGSVLIGRLPFAEFHQADSGDFAASTFICDLFLMDLDGNWTDTNPTDGIYDGHTAIANVTDIYPEIFVGRIDPTSLSWKTNVSDEINTYLSRVHQYRTGGVQRPRSALLYVDDEWVNSTLDIVWAADVASAFSNMTAVALPEWTNATDWLTNRILQDYQWGHLCVRGNSTFHVFGPSGGGEEGTVSSTQIHAASPSFNFYNLFCDYGGLWTATDSLAVAYTFSGNYSLATIGSSKAGGMMDCNYFYGPLGENFSLGESFVRWFTSSLNSNGEAGIQYREWYYGMNIIGDPLLTIHYDCTVLQPEVYSTSHPNSAFWYANAHPQLNWTTPHDVNGIDGFYYVLDRNPSTIPVPEIANFTMRNGILITDVLDDGNWYLHILARDTVGNIGNAAHFNVRIDTTPPSSIDLLPESTFIERRSLSLHWTVLDTGSGYARAEIRCDYILLYNGIGQDCTFNNLGEGPHLVNVTAFDSAMNSMSVLRTYFIDLADPLVSIISPTTDTLHEQKIELEWSVIDVGSGYQRAEIVVDGIQQGDVQSPTTNYTIMNLTWDIHTIVLIVYDWVDRTTAVELQVILRPLIPEYLPPFMIITGFGLIVVLIITLREKE